MEDSLVAGDEVELVLEFSANQSRSSYYTYGFYPRPCSGAEDAQQCWFTQGESTNARNAFPCQDEPGLKATIKYIESCR